MAHTQNAQRCGLKSSQILGAQRLRHSVQPGPCQLQRKHQMLPSEPAQQTDVRIHARPGQRRTAAKAIRVVHHRFGLPGMRQVARVVGAGLGAGPDDAPVHKRVVRGLETRYGLQVGRGKVHRGGALQVMCVPARPISASNARSSEVMITSPSWLALGNSSR